MENSDKRENFKRLAESRTNKIIDMLNLLGNLSNTSYYEYDMKEVNTIFNAIKNELDIQRKRFDEKKSRKKKFRL